MIDSRGIGSNRGSDTAGGLDQLVTGMGKEKTGSSIGDIAIGKPELEKFSTITFDPTVSTVDPKKRSFKGEETMMLMADMTRFCKMPNGTWERTPFDAQKAPDYPADQNTLAKYSTPKAETPAEPAPVAIAGSAMDASTVNVAPNPAQEILNPVAAAPEVAFA